ncbi:MAG: ribonuclease H-like domain-containing protein [Sphingobacteriales bacterium]|jgi:DNA polymerase elongation subunit (family B)|nr:ribonuclease H-like domain-containing protein [Sphingobacteriales bacterium]MBP9140359.1 ribonuclease H-like domain-containing protein [Chitinophagales bacterium]MDA0199572.1 ribonuclease H-like domain-containing protein [Bacteroidota bacterium]MBK6890047.1 ribonuclease H-like domain-containing protein [Sphingobacteriales bacterium]MBK7527427.1 ribonuclease H-like domain-containing protein [Sphingobacteriales bacterium]
MLEHIPIHRILFIDLETVAQQPSYQQLSPVWQQLWEGRVNQYKPDNIDWDTYYNEKAAVYAEFSKIVCASIGYFAKPRNPDEPEIFRIKSFYDHDEPTLLTGLFEALRKYFSRRAQVYLGGHNIRDFDVPFMARRALINQIPLPQILDATYFKPWEQPYVDTLQLWKFGEFRNLTSLNLITTALDIPSPKTDLTGREVGHVYWHDRDLNRIKNYCEADVIAVAQLTRRFKNLPLIANEQIQHVA